MAAEARFESFGDKNHAQTTSDNANDINKSPNDKSFEDKISFDRISQNRAQIRGANDMNDPNDIIRPSQDSNDIEEKAYYSCYYCNDFKTNDVKDYERHVINRHPNKPAYPCKIDFERLGIKAQGKSWEI